jgi:hypothetical protein
LVDVDLEYPPLYRSNVVPDRLLIRVGLPVCVRNAGPRATAAGGCKASAGVTQNRPSTTSLSTTCFLLVGFRSFF